jgi:hypothetical protein
LCRCGGEANPETRNRSKGKFTGVARFEGDSKRRNDQDHKSVRSHCADEIEHNFSLEVGDRGGDASGPSAAQFPGRQEMFKIIFCASHTLIEIA